MTLGESIVEHSSLAKVSQLGWFGMSTNETSLQFSGLGIVLIVIHNGSWMNMMSKFWLTSRIMLMRKLFFCMFWENIFKSFKIILMNYLQLNKFFQLFQIFAYSFECHFLLKWSFQKGHSYESAWCLPLQLRHLNERGQGLPFFVSNLGGLVSLLA